MHLSIKNKPTTETLWGSRKIRGKTGLPFPGKNTMSTPRNNNNKKKQQTQKQTEKNTTKTNLQCFRTDLGEKTRL